MSRPATTPSQAGPHRVWSGRPRAQARLAGTAVVLGLGLLAALLTVASSGSPLVPVIVVGGAVLVGFAVINPIAVVCLGVLVVPLEGFFPGTLVGPSQGVFGAAAIGWAIRWGVSRPLRFPGHPIIFAFGVLVLANVVGLLYAPEPLFVIRQVITWGTLFVVALCIAGDGRETTLRNVLLAVAVSGGLAGAIAVLDPQPLVGAVFEGGDVNRATGGLGSPNALGMLLGLAIPIQIVFALRGPSLPIRGLGAACLALAMAGMALSVSRGAFIGMGASLLLLCLWSPFRRVAILVLPLVLILSLVGHNPASPIGGKVVERLSEVRSTGSTNPRLILWRAAPRMIEDRPIFGQGAFQYGYYTSSYGILATEGVVGHAHDLFLTITIELGLFGGLAMLAIFLASARGLPRVIRATSGMNQGLAFGLAASLTGFFTCGILDYSLGAAPIAGIFFVIVGCTAAACLTFDPGGRRAGLVRPRTGLPAATGRPQLAVTRSA